METGLGCRVTLADGTRGVLIARSFHRGDGRFWTVRYRHNGWQTRLVHEEGFVTVQAPAEYQVGKVVTLNGIKSQRGKIETLEILGDRTLYAVRTERRLRSGIGVSSLQWVGAESITTEPAGVKLW